MRFGEGFEALKLARNNTFKALSFRNYDKFAHLRPIYKLLITLYLRV